MSIRIEPAGESDAQLWQSTVLVAHLLSDLPWLLIGGQMVALLEHEKGRLIGRRTVDVDAVLDVSATRGATRLAAQRLLADGFEVQPAHDGYTYRFVKRDATVDLMSIDRVGAKADRRTVPPGRAPLAHGSRRAYRGRREIEVEIGTFEAVLPVPTVGGAIALKVRAAGLRQEPRDVRDLARLLALVDDIRHTRAELSTADRRGLAVRQQLADPTDPIWSGISEAQDGAVAYGRLCR